MRKRDRRGRGFFRGPGGQRVTGGPGARNCFISRRLEHSIAALLETRTRGGTAASRSFLLIARGPRGNVGGAAAAGASGGCAEAAGPPTEGRGADDHPGGEIRRAALGPPKPQGGPGPVVGPLNANDWQPGWGRVPPAKKTGAGGTRSGSTNRFLGAKGSMARRERKGQGWAGQIEGEWGWARRKQ